MSFNDRGRKLRLVEGRIRFPDSYSALLLIHVCSWRSTSTP